MNHCGVEPMGDLWWIEVIWTCRETGLGTGCQCRGSVAAEKPDDDWVMDGTNEG